MAGKSSTGRVAAYRERMRREGHRRLQLDVRLSPEDQAFLDEMVELSEGRRPRADVVREVLSAGFAVMRLSGATRLAVDRILFEGEEVEGET